MVPLDHARPLPNFAKKPGAYRAGHGCPSSPRAKPEICADGAPWHQHNLNANTVSAPAQTLILTLVTDGYTGALVSRKTRKRGWALTHDDRVAAFQPGRVKIRLNGKPKTCRAPRAVARKSTAGSFDIMFHLRFFLSRARPSQPFGAHSGGCRLLAGTRLFHRLWRPIGEAMRPILPGFQPRAVAVRGRGRAPRSRFF